MPNELTMAVVGFAIIALGVAGALLKLVPPYIEKQLAAKDRERQEQFETDKQERDSRIAELTVRVEESKTLVAQIAKSNETQERLIDRIVDIASQQSTNNKVVQANTNAIAGNTEAIGDLKTEMTANSEKVDARLKALEDGVSKINTTIQGLPNCESYTAEIAAMEARIMSAIREQAKRETTTTPALPANVTVDDAGAGSEAAA